MKKWTPALINRAAFGLNLVLLGLAPALAMGAILLSGGWDAYDALPWWGMALPVSWAFSINMWMLLGALAQVPDRRLQGVLFTLTNFGLPLVVGIASKDEPALILLEVATYSFMVLGLVSMVTMGLGAVGALKEKGELRAALSGLGLGVGVFGVFLTLPALACELHLLGYFDLSDKWDLLWLGLRYAGMAADLAILLPVLTAETAL